MTRYLLDTHFIYWWMTGDRRLGKAARTLIATTDCSVNVASLWEMLIKNAKGKLPLPEGSIHESLEAIFLLIFRASGCCPSMQGTSKQHGSSRPCMTIRLIGCSRQPQPLSS